MKATIRIAPALLALAAVLLPASSPAQDYPTKAVRIVVTFPPGGSSDVTARTLSVPLQKALGQPASGYLAESLMAAIAQGSDEAKARLKDFLEKRGNKVLRQ